MHYQNAQTGYWLLGLVILSGCVTTPSPDALPSLPCSVTSTIPPSVGQDQATNNNQNRATMTQALQKRLQERERTIAAQTQQIEVLSSQLEALKQIDQETHRQPRKRLTYPIP
jgi:TolA-binding protein